MTETLSRGFPETSPTMAVTEEPTVSVTSSPRTQNPTPIPPLLIVPWHDDVVDQLGFDPRSPYAERFWLPVLGPTCSWLLRRLAHEFDRQPDGFSIDVVQCARSIGIGGRGGHNGPFHRSIDRCVRFGLIREDAHGILAVRTRLPPLDGPAIGRLPRPLQAEHRRWQHEQRQRSAHPATDAHAARLARSLLDVGASPEEVVAQLRRWNFDDEASQRALKEAES